MSKKLLSKLTASQLLEIETCGRCGICTKHCPVYEATKNVKYSAGWRARVFLDMVKGSSVDIAELSDIIYKCSLCGKCWRVCPFGIRADILWEVLRSHVFDLGANPRPLNLMKSAVDKSGNVFGLEPEMRTFWIDYVGLEDANIGKRADLLYFVGCSASFKAQNNSIAHAVCLILNELGENWTILGDEEACCGAPSMMMGDHKTAMNLAKENLKRIKALGVKTVVTACPACYRTLRWRYARMAGDIRLRVYHIAEYLYIKLKAGKLKADNKYEGKLIYHDPCELARLGGVIEEPRHVLNEFTEGYLEFDEKGIDSKCCGGGGLLQAVDNELRLKICENKVNVAISKNAELIVSACPSCKLTFLDAVKHKKAKIKVLDIAELVAQQLGLQ